MTDIDALVSTLRETLRDASQGGGEKFRTRHTERGKLFVRDRIDLILDAETAFMELSPLAAHDLYGGEVPGAGIVTGIGMIHDQPCMIIANDATVKGGSFFAETVRKHSRAQEIAQDHRLPCIYLVDCGGAFLPEQDRVFPDRDHFGGAFWRQCQMSAEGIPQISVVFGGCTAGGAYIPALSDQVIMVRGTGRIHLGGPPIVKAAINEVVDGETLGGADMQTTVSGVSDHIAPDEITALQKLREIVANLGDGRRIPPPLNASVPPKADHGTPQEHAPVDLKRPTDMRALIRSMVDGSELSEFKPDYGSTLITGFARIHGYPVGILANDGALFSESSVKGAHFIELCDQRQIPLIFLQNITGFMVGRAAEEGGIAKHGAKLVTAVSCAKVPKFTVIVGGSYGAGNYGMCGRAYDPRFLFMWPNARISVMGGEQAAGVLSTIQSAGDKDWNATKEAALKDRIRADYERMGSPYYSSARGWDDGIIDPADTRTVLTMCLFASLNAEIEDTRFGVFRM